MSWLLNLWSDQFPKISYLVFHVTNSDTIGNVMSYFEKYDKFKIEQILYGFNIMNA